MHIIFGVVCYAAFGKQTQDMIIFNLPLKNKLLGLV